ncbi:MAG: phage portal protein [Clostridiales bacterium]|jgi:hypothetical protein|nr:phage portal protein [Clostridiales bacterium]
MAFFGKFNKAFSGAFDKKHRTEIVRDNNGNVTSLVSSADIERLIGKFKSRVWNGNHIELFNSIAEIQMPVRLIIERALNAEIKLKNFDTDEVLWNNKEISKLLSRPNEINAFYEFFSQIIGYYLVTGNTYIYSYLPGTMSDKLERWKRMIASYVLPSHKVKIIYRNKPELFQGADISEIVEKYRLSTGASSMDFDPKNILNIHELNLSFDGEILKGKSRLESLKYPISNIMEAYEARNDIFAKRGALGFLTGRKTDETGSVPLIESEKKQIRNSYYENYGFGDGKFPVGIIDVPIDFVNVGVSIRELEPFKETLEDAKTIFNTFGVPDFFVPGNTSSTYNNIESAEKSLYQDTVIPLVNRIVESLNEWLGLEGKIESAAKGRKGTYLYADFSDITWLQEDKRKEAETNRIKDDIALKRFNAGAITYNRMLVMMGEEEVADGDYYVWDERNKNKKLQTQNQNTKQ